jgi:tryptophan halogenase
MAALALKAILPGLQVKVIRSKDIGIIGVGEGSTIPLVRFLHTTLQVPLKSFYDLARPTWKLGLKFIWGPRPHFFYPFGLQVTSRVPELPRPIGHYCAEEMNDWDTHSSLMIQDKVFVRRPDGKPQMHASLSYHFENDKFVMFLETYAQSMGIEIVEDTVAEATQNDAGITGLKMKSGTTQTADLYVDCSGFISFLLGKTLKEPFDSFKSSLFCDRAVVGGWARSDEPIKPYTLCETMQSGWCWQIEHENRINRGYVYSSDFISDEDADREYKAQNPKVAQTRVVKFVSGRYRRGWVKNVVAIGNSTGFVEPLEATALGVIAAQATRLANVLRDSDREIRPTQIKVYNHEYSSEWDCIRGFIAMHYKFNRRIDNKFWRACQNDTELCTGQPLVDYYLENGPAPFWDTVLCGGSRAFRSFDFATLMLGQRVEWKSRREPSASEKAAWAVQRQKNKSIADNGFTVKEALDAVHAPGYQWEPSALTTVG